MSVDRAGRGIEREADLSAQRQLVQLVHGPNASPQLNCAQLIPTDAAHCRERPDGSAGQADPVPSRLSQYGERLGTVNAPE